MNNRIDSDIYAGHLVLKGLADNTVRNYRCLHARWCDYAVAYDRDPDRPDPLTVRAWAAQLQGSRSIIAQARAMIMHLCELAQVDNVSSAIPLPRQPRKPRSRGLHPEQARRLARAADRAGIKGLAVLVALYTGARRGEVARLRWADVDLDAARITFDRTKTRDRHTVPLHPSLLRRLEVRWVPGETWVFPGRHGGHVTPALIWQWVADVAAQAGVGKVTPHQLRHTLVKQIHVVTKDIRAAQDIAGHADIRTTSGYVYESEEELRDAIGLIDWLGEGA